MPNSPNMNFNFNAPLNQSNVAGNIEGDMNINQNNDNRNNQTINQTLVEVKKIIEELKQKHPQVNNEQEATKIIDAEFEEHKSTKSPTWKKLLELKRVFNGSKQAAIKIGEHFAEESPLGKALIGFFEGVTEDVE